MVYWGVNSWNRADTVIHGRSLFNIVKDYAHGTVPSFWGRYIGVGSHTHTPPLTLAEAEFIFRESGHMCRILVIYNGSSGSQMRGGFADGVDRGRDATNRAKDAGVPPGVRIYLDIEPQWEPTADFLLGWWDAMKHSAYAGMGGVYANPDFHNIRRPYFAALSRLSLEDRVMYTRYHWSTRPNMSCRHHPLDMLSSFHPRRMGQRADIAVPGSLADWTDPVVLWQYARSCLGTGHGLVDLDLADHFGYADLWASASQPAHIAAATSLARA